MILQEESIQTSSLSMQIDKYEIADDKVKICIACMPFSGVSWGNLDQLILILVTLSCDVAEGCDKDTEHTLKQKSKRLAMGLI